MRSQRLFVAVVGGIVLGATVLTLTLGRREGASGSSLSRGPGGWLVARRFLESQGVETRLRRRPAAPVVRGAALVVVLPLQRRPSAEALDAARNHVRLGGTLILGYAGGLLDPVEEHVLDAFGVHLQEGAPLPLNPWRWREQRRSEWTLVPEDAWAHLGASRIRRLVRVPRIPPSAHVLHRDQEGRALTASLPVGRGRVFLLPAEVLSNARLHQPEHVALLEALIDETGSTWVFDEYHHGLSAPADPTLEPSLRALDLWMVHAALVYLLAVLALVRRFGPAWREPPVTTGSPSSFFLGLGSLARRLRLHREAAALLMARARELDPKVEIGRGAVDFDDETHFLGLARVVARAQKRRTP